MPLRNAFAFLGPNLLCHAMPPCLRVPLAQAGLTRHAAMPSLSLIPICLAMQSRHAFAFLDLSLVCNAIAHNLFCPAAALPSVAGSRAAPLGSE